MPNLQEHACGHGTIAAVSERRTSQNYWIAACAYIVAFLALAPVANGQEPASHRILLLYSDNHLLPAISRFDQNIRERFHAELGLGLEFYNEFMDLERFPKPEGRMRWAEYLAQKYSETRIDLIVAVRGPALKFLMEYRDRIGFHAPVVHAAVERMEMKAYEGAANLHGIPIDFELDKTIALALQLHPRAKRLISITGSSVLDQHWQTLVREASTSFKGKLEFEYWSELPLEDVLDKVKRLPPDSFILCAGLLQDGKGYRYVPRMTVKRIVEVSTAPLYAVYNAVMDTGAVGGCLAVVEDMAQYAAQMGAQIIRDKPLSELRLPARVPNRNILDYRQLRRWGVRDEDIPADSVLLFKEPTFIESYWAYVVAAVSIFLLQGGLIGALLLQRRKRQRSEAALQTSEKQMELAARSASLGLWIWDAKQDSLWLSPQCRALLNGEGNSSEGIGWFFGQICPEDRGRVEEIVRRALTQGGDYQTECRVLNTDGTPRWIVTRGRVELSENRAADRLLGVVLDITAQRKLESDIQQTRRDLEHLTRVSMMGELASALAHELNQPLAAILSNAQAAKRYLAANQYQPKEFEEILADIIRDDKRAGDVIQRMRAMLRKGELKFERLNVNALISEVVSLLNSELIGRNIRVGLNLSRKPPLVSGGHVEIQQVLMNLIMNAIEAMEAQPGSDRNLSVATHVKDRYIHVSVRDSGVGVSEERIRDIAKPFTSTKKDGLGMGLAICCRILESHGGRLWAENNPDTTGATFLFSLPVDESAGPEANSHDA